MKVRLVFCDWVKNGQSIYETEEGIELSLGDFHHGTTFNADIDVYGSDAELTKYLKKGIYSSFLCN